MSAMFQMSAAVLFLYASACNTLRTQCHVHTCIVFQCTTHPSRLPFYVRTCLTIVLGETPLTLRLKGSEFGARECCAPGVSRLGQECEDVAAHLCSQAAPLGGVGCGRVLECNLMNHVD